MTMTMNEIEIARRSVLRIFLSLAIAGLAVFYLFGCTLSFHNVSTHGSAQDLIDEQQTTSPDVKPNVAIPITPSALP